MSGKSMLRYGHKLSRMSVVTSQEQRWIDALLESEHNLTRFTATEAVRWLASIPTKKGKTRSMIPNAVKLNYTLRKSKEFECMTIEKTKNTTNEWRLIQ